MTAFSRAYASGISKPKTSLLDRALNDLGNITSGFIPGLAEIGSSIGNDVFAAMPGTPNNFKLPALAKRTGQGMWNESALPPLLLGDPGEALRRASERPVSALLDASLLFPAATGAARLGVKTGIGRQAGLDLLGARTLTPDSRDAFMDHRMAGTTGDMPAVLEAVDGPILTREHLPMTSGDLLTFGGDVALRRTQRTIKSSAAPAVALGRGPDDVLEMGQHPKVTELDAIFAKPQSVEGLADKTLRDDEWRHYQTYRSANEPIAQIGDFLHNLRAKIPADKKFSHDHKIGRLMTRRAQTASREDQDIATATHAKLAAAAIAVIKENKGVDEETARNMLADTDLLQALDIDSVEGIARAIRNLDPAYALTDKDLGALRSKTLRQLYEDDGIFFEHERPGVTDGHWSDNVFGSMTLDRFLNDFRGDLRRVEEDENGEPVLDEDGNPKWASPFKMKIHGAAHRSAYQQRMHAREQLTPTMAEAVHHLRKLNVTPQLFNKDTNEVIELSDQNLLPIEGDMRVPNESIMDRVLKSGDWILTYKNEGIGDQHRYASEAHLRQEVQDTLREHIYRWREANSRADAYDKHSNVLLNQYRLYGDDAKLVSRGGSGPGIVDRIRAAEQHRLDSELLERSELKDYYQFINELRERSRGYHEARLGHMFGKGEQEAAINRFPDWIHGTAQGSETGEGNYFPMRPKASDPIGKFKSHKDNPDAILEYDIDTGPGDPHDVFLSGEFRSDYETILDDFKKNRQYHAGYELLNHAKDLSVRVPESKYQELLQGDRVIEDVEAIEQKSWKAPYVRVNEKGIFGDIIAETTGRLQTLKAAKLADGDTQGAQAIADTIKLMQRFKLHDPRSSTAEGLESDKVARGQMVGEPPEAEVLLLPTEIFRAMSDELKASQKAVNAVLEAGTDMWKWTVLHARFLSWMRNNLIGAHLMVAMAGGPAQYLNGVNRMMSPGYKEMKEKVHAELPGLFASGSSQQARSINMSPEHTKKGKFERKVINPLSDINAKYADDPAREMRLFQLMDEQLKIVSKLKGEKPGDLTIEDVDKFMNDDVLREMLAKRTKTEMVDFNDMSEAERRYVRAVFPFWSWMKGSTKATTRTFADNPGKVWVAGEIGDVGEEEMLQDHGHFVPDFAKSWWDPGEEGGFAVSTSGMLPWQTALDWPAMGMGLVPNIPNPLGDEPLARTGVSYRQFGSENIASGMHPILSGGLEALAGRNMFFGTPLPNGNIGGSFLGEQANVPPVQFLLKQLKNETGPDATTQYNRGLHALNFLGGIPVVDPRWGDVRSRGVDELNERYKTPLAWRELTLGES